MLVRGPNGQVGSAGTFQVRDSGSWTFPMTSAADPHDFRAMEITLGPPSKNGDDVSRNFLVSQDRHARLRPVQPKMMVVGRLTSGGAGAAGVTIPVWLPLRVSTTRSERMAQCPFHTGAAP
jgi:hypothetical protein